MSLAACGNSQSLGDYLRWEKTGFIEVGGGAGVNAVTSCVIRGGYRIRGRPQYICQETVGGC